jgi:hypothetical protein
MARGSDFLRVEFRCCHVTRCCHTAAAAGESLLHAATSPQCEPELGTLSGGCDLGHRSSPRTPSCRLVARNLGSCAKSHAPATPPRPRVRSRARPRPPCGPTQWLPGPTQPGRTRCGARSRGPFFGRKLGRTSGNRPRAGFGNLKSFFHFPGYFKSMQTSKIHIKFNIHPKFMKQVSLFF